MEIPEDDWPTDDANFQKVEGAWADVRFQRVNDTPDNDSAGKKTILKEIATQGSVDAQRRRKASQMISEIEAKEPPPPPVNEPHVGSGAGAYPHPAAAEPTATATAKAGPTATVVQNGPPPAPPDQNADPPFARGQGPERQGVRRRDQDAQGGLLPHGRPRVPQHGGRGRARGQAGLADSPPTAFRAGEGAGTGCFPSRLRRP